MHLNIICSLNKIILPSFNLRVRVLEKQTQQLDKACPCAARCDISSGWHMLTKQYLAFKHIWAFGKTI